MTTHPASAPRPWAAPERINGAWVIRDANGDDVALVPADQGEDRAADSAGLIVERVNGGA